MYERVITLYFSIVRTLVNNIDGLATYRPLPSKDFIF